MCIFPELREERLALFPDSIGRAFEISPPRRAISGGGGWGGGWQTEVTTGQRVKPRSESRNAPPTLTRTAACGRGSEHFSLLLSSSVDGHDGDGEALAAILDRRIKVRGRRAAEAERWSPLAGEKHPPPPLTSQTHSVALVFAPTLVNKVFSVYLLASLAAKTLLLPRFLSSQSLTSHTVARRPPNEKTTTSKDGARPLPFHSHAETASRRWASGGR